MSEPHIAQENSNLKTLIVGGGCFWCQDAVYRQTKGVVES
ncbi:MAG: peptide-methionine (S)-S-oxide reductase, partial [Yaniella sp.]